MSRSRNKLSLSALFLLCGLSFASQQAFSATESAFNIAAGQTATKYFAHNQAPGSTTFTDNFIFNFAPSATSANVVSINWGMGPIGLQNVTASLYDLNVSGVTPYASGNVLSFTSPTPLTFNIGGANITHLFNLIVTGTIGTGGAYSAQVSAVPLPAATWLFISGFLAVGGWSVIKKKRDKVKFSNNGAVAL